jgi:peptidoglycan/xylan/chitin deacetylase (PgdA/CDA1 family)
MKVVRRALKRLLDNRLIYFTSRRNVDGVVLTFDDGPDPERTPLILQILDEYKAKAVFFPIGSRAEAHPDLVREIRDRGHTLGNHTYSHLNDLTGGRYTNFQYWQEIRKAQRLLRDLANVETRLFRPPRGELNLSNVPAIIASRHKIIYWSLEAGEWGRRKSESGEALAEYVVQRIQPRDVLLLHDDSPKTLSVLQRLLPHVQRQGWDLSQGLLV